MRTLKICYARKAKITVEVKEKEVEATEDSEEILFGEEDLENSGLRELVDKGKDQGFLTYEDINSMLPEDISDLIRLKRQSKC